MEKHSNYLTCPHCGGEIIVKAIKKYSLSEINDDDLGYIDSYLDGSTGPPPPKSVYDHFMPCCSDPVSQFEEDDASLDYFDYDYDEYDEDLDNYYEEDPESFQDYEMELMEESQQELYSYMYSMVRSSEDGWFYDDYDAAEPDVPNWVDKEE